MFIKANPDAKALAVVYYETSTGVTARSLEEIGKFCEEEDILLVVDAISILGGDKLPVDDWSVDMCVTASQKCLMCPPGLSFVTVSQRPGRRSSLRSITGPSTWTSPCTGNSWRAATHPSPLRYRSSTHSTKPATWFWRKDCNHDTRGTEYAQKRFTTRWKHSDST